MWVINTCSKIHAEQVSSGVSFYGHNARIWDCHISDSVSFFSTQVMFCFLVSIVFVFVVWLCVTHMEVGIEWCRSSHDQAL